MSTPAGTTQLSYELGDLVSMTNPVGHTTTRYTDNAGRPVSVTTPGGQRTRYDYNALNQLTKVTDPLGGLTQVSYDPNGNLLSVTDARNSVTSYGYNGMDWPVTRTDSLSRAETYAYDSNGNATNLTDRKSQVTQTTYDALNRPTQVTYQDSSTTAYTWDAGNRPTQIGDSISGTITRAYDALDRRTQETTPQGTVSYAYDAAGRRTSMTVLGQSTVSYAYDNADRLTQITQGTATVSFTYDNADRRTSLTLPNGTVTEYSYDAASRLTGLTYKVGATTLGALTYTYDGNGNRTQIGGTWARTGIPQPVTAATYNAANHQLTFGAQSLTYDLNGNLTSDGVNTYTWDARDRLVAISGGTTGSFQYDAFGRRTSKTINGTQTGFLYDGLDPVQELSGTTVVTNLLTGLGVDEFFTRTDGGGTSALLTDALGSMLALADATGAIQTQYTYEPFGATSVTGAGSTNALQYTGRENDATGLFYYRARYYSPTRQRFISEDPLGFGAGDLNLYAYVFNNPVNTTDPSGEIIPAVAAACLSGAAAGAAADLLSGLLSGRKPTLGELAGDAGVGCLSGLAGFGAGKLAGTLGKVIGGLGKGAGIGSNARTGATGLAREGIYDFTAASGKTYVGQSGNISERIAQHIASGKLPEANLATLRNTEVLGGKTVREVAEQVRINELGGIGNLENIRNPIGPARRYLLP